MYRFFVNIFAQIPLPGLPYEQRLHFGNFRWLKACDNRSIFYRACAKFVTPFASKINREVCRQMARVSRELKKLRQL